VFIFNISLFLVLESSLSKSLVECRRCGTVYLETPILYTRTLHMLKKLGKILTLINLGIL
jgi:hypothetical protein